MQNSENQEQRPNRMIPIPFYTPLDQFQIPKINESRFSNMKKKLPEVNDNFSSNVQILMSQDPKCKFRRKFFGIFFFRLIIYFFPDFFLFLTK